MQLGAGMPHKGLLASSWLAEGPLCHAAGCTAAHMHLIDQLLSSLNMWCIVPCPCYCCCSVGAGCMAATTSCFWLLPGHCQECLSLAPSRIPYTLSPTWRSQLRKYSSPYCLKMSDTGILLCASSIMLSVSKKEYLQAYTTTTRNSRIHGRQYGVYAGCFAVCCCCFSAPACTATSHCWRCEEDIAPSHVSQQDTGTQAAHRTTQHACTSNLLHQEMMC